MDTKSWKVYGSVMILGTTDTYMQRSACRWWSVLHGHFAFMYTQTASRNSWSHNVTGFFLGVMISMLTWVSPRSSL